MCKTDLQNDPVHLPFELLSEIFALACTDGGKAGRSLSLASHYFSEIVEPFQWKSLAFHSLSEVELFAHSVDGAPHRKKQGARHMFISCPALGVDGCGNPRDVLRHPVRLFHDVFKAVAPTLETLVFYANIHPRFAHFQYVILRGAAAKVSAGWPKMTELTLRSQVSLVVVNGGNSLKSSMPNLQRVHLSAPGPVAYYHYHQLFSPPPPSSHGYFEITHLRISEVDDRYSQEIIYHLRRLMIERASAPWRRTLEEHPVELAEIDIDDLRPPGLKHFIIQAACLEDRAVIDRYLEAATGADHVLQITLLPIADYCLAELYKDWIDRTRGGPGCWKAVEI